MATISEIHEQILGPVEEMLIPEELVQESQPCESKPDFGYEVLMSAISKVRDLLDEKIASVQQILEQELDDIKSSISSMPTEDDLLLITKKISHFILEERLPQIIKEEAKRAVQEIMPEILLQLKDALSSIPPPNVTVEVQRTPVRKNISYDHMSRPSEIIEQPI